MLRPRAFLWRPAHLCVVLALLAASPAAAMTPPGTSIDNTASADYLDSGTPATVLSNTDTVVTVAADTPSSLELLHYAPGNPLATSYPVAAAPCSASGGGGGPFGPPPPLTDTAGSPIDLANPVELAAGGAFHAGEPVFVRVRDPDQNLDPMAIDQIVVTWTTSAGDAEALALQETAVNTGEFVGGLMSGPSPTLSGDCRLQASPGDTFDARYVDPNDGSDVSVASVLVDPLGRVFDSATGAPVDGAIVELVDASSGTPALVFGDDGVSSFPSTLTSGGSASDSGGTLYNFAPGAFRFPLVAAGSYALRVTPPASYSHPSAVADVVLQGLPGAPYALGPGSRGLSFAVPVGPAVEVDIPLDAGGSGSLLLTMGASKTQVQVGEFLVYTLQLSNPAGALPASSLTLHDALPPGFRYQDGSLEINGSGAPDPQRGGDGTSFQLALPPLAAGAEHEIRYVALVGAGTSSGGATNRAQAFAAGGLASNEASLRVEVEEEVLAERSFLVGRVMAGGCDDPMTANHTGVPGVRLFLENGTYVVTDDEGRFHFAGLSPDTHVLQMDVDTIPPGYELLACPGNAFAGRAFSRFVEPQPGSMWRTDFFLRRTAPEGPSLRQEFSVRRDGDTLFFRLRYALQGGGLERGSATVVLPRGTRYVEGSANAPGELLGAVEHNAPAVTFRLGGIANGDTGELNFSATAAGAPEDTDPEAAIRAFLRGRSEVGTTLQTEVAEVPVPPRVGGERETRNVQHTEIPPAPEATPGAVPDSDADSSDPFQRFGYQWLEDQKTGNAWVFPETGAIPAIPATKIVLQHDPALHVRLFHNGTRVSPLNFDSQVKTRDGRLAVSRWRGVDLDEGPNRFHVLLEDAEGQLVEQLEHRVHYSGSPVSAELARDESYLVADGRETPVVAVRFRDRWGQPVRPGITGVYHLDPPYQSEAEVEAQRTRPLEGLGVQEPTYRVTENGTAYIRLHPTTVVGDARLRFPFLDGREEEVDAWLEPGEREWVLVALATGSLGFSEAGGSDAMRREAGVESGLYQEGRMAFFAKGSVKGSWLLTAAFDSAASRSRIGDRLLQALDPDEHYTLYGDTTEQGHEAPTSDRLYLKIERRKFYALYGDYETGLGETELGNYARTFTGVKTEFRGDRVRWNAFATDSDQIFTKDEIQGNGTSGLYRLSRPDVVINSETVTLETRDRFRNDRVLESQSLARHIDYNINYQDGTLYFRTPVPSRDPRFHPIFIVVDYESESGGGDHYTGGGRAAATFFDDTLELGVSGLHEDNGERAGHLVGGDATLRLGPRTELRGEFASAESDDLGTGAAGDAWLVEFEHRGEDWDVGAYVREQQEGFGLGQQNAVTSSLRSFGVDTEHRVTERVEIDTTAFHQQNLDTKDERSVLGSELSYFDGAFGLRGGVRYARNDNEGEIDSTAQLLAGTQYAFWNRRLTLRADGEYAVAGEDRQGDYPSRVVLGGDYRLNDAVQLFADQEFGFGERRTENTRVGLQATPWNGGSISTSLNQESREYGPRTFANLGLQQRFTLNPEWSFDVLVDRAQTLRDGGTLPFSSESVPASGSSGDDFTAVSVGSSFRRGSWSSTGRVESRIGDTSNQWGLLLGTLRDHDADTSYSGRLHLFLTDPKSAGDQIELESSLSLAHRPLDSRWVALERFDVDFLQRPGDGAGLETLKLVNHLKLNYELDRRTQFAFQYSAKFVLDQVGGESYSSVGNLVGFEARRDLTDKWDIEAHARLRQTSGNGVSFKPNYGVSVGRRLYDNLWLSVGYNFAGFHDTEFSGSEYTAHGPFMRLRAKVDHVTVKSLLQRFAE